MTLKGINKISNRLTSKFSIMKTTRILLTIAFAVASLFSQAQYRKNGMPDMRYGVNRSYSSSSVSSYSMPSVRYQSGYVKSNGTYVQPHFKTTSNYTNLDNYSTVENTNPYTGARGTKATDYSPNTKNYGSGSAIYSGSRGGQYYINSNGNKTYIPKLPSGF